MKQNRLLEQIDEYLSKGWKKGMGRKGKKKVMHHPDYNVDRQISINQIDEYLAKGYILGGIKRKKIFKGEKYDKNNK